MEGYYRFGVTFRVPTEGDVVLTPERFETQLRVPAPTPDPAAPPADWAFFRAHLWRGELNAPDHFGGLVADWIGRPVESVRFAALEVDPEYRDALRRAVAANLGAFRAEDADAAIGKYLGSRIEVTETDSLNAADR